METKTFYLHMSGIQGVGKTTLIRSLCEHYGTELPPMREELRMFGTPVNFKIQMDSQIVSLTCYDTSSDRDYDRQRGFVMSTNANKFTFASVKEFCRCEVKLNCPEVPTFLIGLHSDAKQTGSGAITNEELQKMTDVLGCIAYMECNATKPGDVAAMVADIVEQYFIYCKKNNPSLLEDVRKSAKKSAPTDPAPAKRTCALF